MHDILEVYNNYRELGIKNRQITEGKEIELVREYIDYRKEEFRPEPEKKMMIFLESKVDNAYPDIVFVEYNPENYLDWNQKRFDLGKEDLKILYHLYVKKGLDGSEIVTQLGVSWKDAMLCIERLYDAKLVTRNNGKWGLIDENKIMPHKIEAVEAKLNKWDEVLQQSIINKNFASESYALSVSESKPSREMLNKFRRFGIGVYLRRGNTFDRTRQAVSKNIPVSFHSIHFNEWVGRIINSERG